MGKLGLKMDKFGLKMGKFGLKMGKIGLKNYPGYPECFILDNYLGLHPDIRAFPFCVRTIPTQSRALKYYVAFDIY